MVRNSNVRSKSPSLAERRARETRRRILGAAARVFRQRGLAAAGMREIAAAAELSPANLYYYFSSKDELVFFCQDDSLDRMLEAARRAARETRSPRERLRRVIEAQLVCMLSDLEGAAAHLDVEALPERLRAPILEKRDRYERALRRIVKDGVARGAFRRCDATLVTRAILGAVNWTARWYRPEGARSAAEVASAFSDYLLRGLLR